MKKVLVIVFCFFCLASSATHLRCGHIALSHISGLTYEVKIIVYTNLGSPVKFSDGTLSFGDGTSLQTPTTENTSFAPGIGLVTFTTTHTFPGAGDYKLTYVERNLTAGILNIANSVNTPFYLEASASLDPAVPYFSPDFLAPPIFRQAVGKPFSLSHMAVDKNDYQLRYQLVSPLYPTLTSYSFPENLKVNYYNGLVTWDTKFMGRVDIIGEFLFAIRTLQLDKNGKKVGDVIRSFQVVVDDFATGEISVSNPTTDVNGKVFVPQGKSKAIKVIAEANSKAMAWQVFHDINIAPNVSFLQYDSSADSKFYKVASVRLTASPSTLRDNPYIVTLRAESTVNNIKTYRDVSFLFFTKDIDLPPVVDKIDNPTVVTATEPDNELSVYPNPFHSVINIKASETRNLSSYEIVDSMGRQLFQNNFYSSDAVDTSNLPPGLYILKFKKNGTSLQLKILKE